MPTATHFTRPRKSYRLLVIFLSLASVVVSIALLFRLDFSPETREALGFWLFVGTVFFVIGVVYESPTTAKKAEQRAEQKTEQARPLPPAPKEDVLNEIEAYHEAQRQLWRANDEKLKLKLSKNLTPRPANVRFCPDFQEVRDHIYNDWSPNNPSFLVSRDRRAGIPPKLNLLGYDTESEEVYLRRELARLGWIERELTDREMNEIICDSECRVTRPVEANDFDYSRLPPAIAEALRADDEIEKRRKK